MPQQVFGRVTVRLNGQELLTEVGAKLTLSGVSRDTVKGDKVHGFAEKVEEAIVECTINVNASSDLDSLVAMTDGTILFQMDSGQSYVLAHAWQANVVAPASGAGGKCSLKFVAANSQRVS